MNDSGTSNGNPDATFDDGGAMPNGGSPAMGGNDGGGTPVGGGGAGGMSGGGAGGQVAASGAGGNGGNECAMPPQPGACLPGPCDGTCENDACVHECAAEGMCGGSYDMNMIVACGPPTIDFPCILDCKGGGVCPIADEVSCPDVAPCVIQCLEPGSCTGARIQCRGGGCQVNCSAAGCDDTTEVLCGTGPCLIFCEPDADVTLTPGLSCDVQKLGCGP
jgi:hypothetical protein